MNDEVEILAVERDEASLLVAVLDAAEGFLEGEFADVLGLSSGQVFLYMRLKEDLVAHAAKDQRTSPA